MNVLTKPRMTVDEFLVWAADRPGRHELYRGEIVSMSPETVGHLEAKVAVYDALRAAVRASGLSCYVLPDGATVRVDETTSYEADALVYCGQKLPASTIEVPNPVVVVEVLSPSSKQIDTTVKLAGYFRLRSIAHYLIVDRTERSVIHHARGTGGTILTRVITDGVIALDPPGIELAMDDIYGSAPSTGPLSGS